MFDDLTGTVFGFILEKVTGVILQLIIIYNYL